MEQSLDQFFRFAFGVIAMLLLIAGTYLAISDRWKSSLGILSCGFLLVLVIFISRFKIVEGPWGFRAETWDQKQIEAGILVDKLSALSDGIAEQVSLVVSRLGLWDSAYTLPEMEDLIKQLQTLLASADIAPARRNEILLPAYRRVELDYVNYAKRIVEKALELRRREVVELSMDENAEKLRQQQRREQDQDLSRFRSVQATDPQISNITAVMAFVRTAPSLTSRSQDLLAELGELKLDSDYFSTNKKLRRRQDLSYLYKDY